MTQVVDFLVKGFASCFFLTYPIVDYARRHHLRWTGAGLIGTAAGVLCARWIPADAVRCGFVLVGVLFVSVAISDRAEELLGRTDDQRIVIDEWAGYLMCVAWLPKTPLVLLLAFVLFRIVDTFKLFGVNRFSKWPGGWGVVMDDIAGGIIVNAVLHLFPF